MLYRGRHEGAVLEFQLMHREGSHRFKVHLGYRRSSKSAKPHTTVSKNKKLDEDWGKGLGRSLSRSEH